MNEPTITCPSCKSDIKLTESLAGPLVEQTRRQFVEQLNEKDRLVEKAQADIAAEKKRVELERQAIEATVAARMDDARKQIWIDGGALRRFAGDRWPFDAGDRSFGSALAGRSRRRRLR